MAYRNIFYNNRSSNIHLWTWDEEGERVERIYPFKPYLYIKTSDQKSTHAISIFGENLKKVEFPNNLDRNNFLKNSDIKKIYHNLPPEQQFLLDHYPNGIEIPDQPLRIYYLDIETYSAGRKFSKPEDALDVVNLITIFDTITNKYYTWGLYNYIPKSDDVIYCKCKNEKELLRKFLDFWQKEPPDCTSGWNIAGYDIPYLVSRINKILGDEEAFKLSPVNRIWLKTDASVNLKGQKMDRWLISGLTILDYMDLYQTFSLGDRESYSLDYISNYELKEKKVAYNTVSLSELADKDWTTFVDYNIQDVKLVWKLENKLKYIKLVQNLSYKGFVSFERAMGKVSLITGAIAYQASKDFKIIPTYNVENLKRDFEGGYVKEPVPGLYENIVTFDANSLYPNTIITLNISPETKIGKVLEITDKGYHLHLKNGKHIVLEETKFKDLLKREKLSFSKANVLYSQKFKGIIPKFVDNLYSQRVEAKNKMLEYEKLSAEESDPIKKAEYAEYITDNKILSEVYKVVLNSCYGVFSQKYSHLFDIDHAESITLTGQASVKAGGDIVVDFFRKNGVDCNDDQISRYMDTDSCEFSTIIKTNLGAIPIGELYNIFKGENPDNISYYGHEIINVKNKQLKALSYDFSTKTPKMINVKNLIRHKVSKRKFSITVGSSNVIVTEDHGCIVLRNGVETRVSPKELRSTDLMLKIIY